MMGSKVRKLAEQMNLPKQRLTTLFARPRKFRMTFSKSVPDLVDAIRDYVAMQDSTMQIDKSGGGRNFSFYIIGTEKRIYVEALIKMMGFVAMNPSNMGIQINIYTDNEEYIRGIANAINSCWADQGGLQAHMEWDKIAKKFGVNPDDAIAAWKQLLG